MKKIFYNKDKNYYLYYMIRTSLYYSGLYEAACKSKQEHYFDTFEEHTLTRDKYAHLCFHLML